MYHMKVVAYTVSQARLHMTLLCSDLLYLTLYSAETLDRATDAFGRFFWLRGRCRCGTGGDRRRSWMSGRPIHDMIDKMRDTPPV